MNNPIRCLKEMVRLAKDKLVIADINKKRKRIMQKVHGLDGHSHSASKMSLQGVKAFLDKAGLSVKAYRAIPGTVADIVSHFTKGGLEEITVSNACAQHGCH